MKTLIVGDLHGNIEICAQAINQKTTDAVLFLGDFLDSFNRSHQDQALCLKRVLDACEESDRVKSLMGNHERSYYYQEICSGFSHALHKIIDCEIDRVNEHLKAYQWVDNFLVTHAGLSQDLLTARGEIPSDYLAREDYIQVGKARGGSDPIGGIYWNDFNREFSPVDNLKQVFGHTHYPYTGAIKTAGAGRSISYNIDCLPQFTIFDEGPAMGLIIEDDEASAVDIFTL